LWRREFVAQALLGEFEELRLDFKADKAAAQPCRDNAGCARTAERIEH